MNSPKFSIAVFSDIHSNHIALENCLEYALMHNIDTFIFLGDYVSDFAYPQKTMQLLHKIRKEYPCYFIRRNKEEYYLNYRENGLDFWKKGSTGALLYTYERLTESDFAFFENLPIMRILSFKNMPSLTICHGSPYSSTENMKPNDKRTLQVMDETDSPIILCGHTHIQNQITNNLKTVLNGGSIGVPYKSNGKSQFLHLYGENGCWIPKFITLPYDTQKAVKELMDSELVEYAPYWCQITANLLQRGTPSHGDVLNKAMQLCKEETGNACWHDIPDKYWEMAIKKLIKDIC